MKLKSVSSMTFVTFISRVFGLVRTILIAHFMGTTLVSDAFAIAFKIPNMFRRLVGEGSLTAALIPVYTDVRKKAADDMQVENEFISQFHKTFGLGLCVFCLVGVVGSPFLVHLLYGFSEKSPEFTVLLTKVMFPYVGFVSLASVATAVLNVRGYFAWPATMPIIMNCTMIIGGYFFWPCVSPEWAEGILGSQDPTLLFAARVAVAMSVSVLLSGLLQWSCQLPLLYRLGYRFVNISFSLRDPDIRRIFKLMLPGVFSLGIYQINGLIADPFALAYLKSGAIAALNYSNRLLEFSLGVFIVSISTVIFPSLSKHVSYNNMDAYRAEFKRGIRLTLWIALPSCVGLMLLAKPIVVLIFQNGVFTHDSSMWVVQALMCHAAGLPVIGISRVYVPAFFSFKDTKTPVTGAFIGLVFNLLGCMLLPPVMGIKGIALSATLASFATMIYMVIKFKSFAPAISGTFMCKPLCHISLVSALMGVVIYVCLPWMETDSRLRLLLRLSSVISLAASVYLAFTYVFRLQVMDDLKTLWQKKKI